MKPGATLRRSQHVEERKTGEPHDQVHCWKHVYLLVNVNRAQQIQAKDPCGPENCDLLFKGNGDVERTGKTSTFWSRTSMRPTPGVCRRSPQPKQDFDISCLEPQCGKLAECIDAFQEQAKISTFWSRTSMLRAPGTCRHESKHHWNLSEGLEEAVNARPFQNSFHQEIWTGLRRVTTTRGSGKTLYKLSPPLLIQPCRGDHTCVVLRTACRRRPHVRRGSLRCAPRNLTGRGQSCHRRSSQCQSSFASGARGALTEKRAASGGPSRCPDHLQ